MFDVENLVIEELFVMIFFGFFVDVDKVVVVVKVVFLSFL